MADNLTAKANTGSGTDVLATDEIGGVHYPRAKIGYGADGEYFDIAENAGLPVLATNIAQRIRSACESYPDTDFWEQTALASGDFIIARGNTGGAGWIEISKSPLTADTETVLSVVKPIRMPIRINAMVSMTHRNAGQQIAQMEFVSDDVADGQALLPTPGPVEILNASQTTTTITINFASAPAVPFRIGQVVSVYGFVDTRLNVNSATVATVPSATQITIVGNDYTFTSTTIGSTNGNGAAFIERTDLLGLARNGVAIVHGSATATQRRAYVRSQGGLARPSGTLAGAHAYTTGTDVSTAAATGYDADAWLAPLETVLMVSRDSVIHMDRATDGNAGFTGRYRSTQIVPNPTRAYRARFRVRSTPSLTRPIAKIVSVSKSGSTTATVTTDGPHGLETGQYVGAYGVRDQTNFANLTTGAACTVTGANTFTVAWGSAVTATSYGGFVMRVQGQQPLGGAIAQVAQSIVRTNNILTVTGNATWAAPAAIGNIVELYGFRDNSSGADLGVDGAYVVTNIAASTLTLTPVSGQAPTGTDIASTNCGGGVIQRLGLRIHAFTAVDYDPLMIEPAFKGTADAGEAQVVAGAVTASVSSATVAGTVAVDAAIGAPVTAGLRASNANIAAMSATGDNVAWLGTMIGAGIVRPYSLPEADWQTPAPVGGLLNTTTAFQLKEAAGAGIRNYVTAIDLWSEALTNATDLRIREADITCNSQTISANTLTTSAAHELVIGDAVVFTAATVTGITASTVTYFVLTVPSTTTLTLSATRGGTTLAISGTGVTATFHKVLWQTRIPTAGAAPRQIYFPTPLRGSINRAVLLQTPTASGAGAVFLSAQGYVAP